MPEQHIDNEKIPTRLIGAIVAVGSLAFIGILTETVMTRGAVDGQVAYCLALFNCFYICKTILHEGFLVLRLGVERDVFRQMLFHARFIMVNVVVCEQYHIHALGDFADGHYQMHPRTFIHAESGLQLSLIHISEPTRPY